MASKKPTVADVAQKTARLALDSTANASAQVDDFYPNRKDKISFARLEKGLLLFIYAYETAKTTLSLEMALWDHRVCFYMIKDGKCAKASEECHYEHQTTYRQTNLCSYWYIGNACQFGSKCKNTHGFETVSKSHQFLLTEIDVDVYKLVRFIRNFAGHYIESVISEKNDRPDLYRNIVIVMVYLVHVLSPKKANSIEHLNLFLEATTINQLIPQNDLLSELEKSYAVPEVFFDLRMNFNTCWYQHNGNKQSLQFSRISPKFLTLFNEIFKGYYEGRLKSRGAKIAWN